MLGTLHVALGASTLFAALIVFTAVAGGGTLSGHAEVIRLTTRVGASIASILLFAALPPLIGGIGLLTRQEWARHVVLATSILNLLSLPVGTAIAVYSLWVLWQEQERDVSC